MSYLSSVNSLAFGLLIFIPHSAVSLSLTYFRIFGEFYEMNWW